MFAPVLILAVTAAGGPMRATGAEVISSQSLMEIQTCATRRLAGLGQVETLPIEGGVAIDFAQRFGLVMIDKARMSFEIRDDGAARHVTVAYLHPVSAKQAVALLADLQRRCLPD